MATDSTARQMLDDYARRHSGGLRLGCSLVAHRDLGYCSNCVSPHDGERVGVDRELAGWRLLAMAERGIPEQPWETVRL